MNSIEQRFEAALQVSLEWQPSQGDLENKATEIAIMTGRDWLDCGAYERQQFIDEAARELGLEDYREGRRP